MSASPWRIDAVAALERWEHRDNPSSERVNALLEWFFACGEHEPPGADDGALAVPFEEELTFVYRVPEVYVVVAYYVLVPERLMLVKEIEDLGPDIGQ